MARKGMARVGRLGLALSAAALVAAIGATTALAGNNGTLKIHERGTPDGTPNNDPKVCSFNVEGFGLDPGQLGWLYFSVQGGDAPTGADQAGGWVMADANGYFESVYFTLQPGHYKATLYGKENLSDVKAKSKVFKVTCDLPDEDEDEDDGWVPTG
jgi:hypothetical protein